MKVLFLGDTISYGSGASTLEKGYVPVFAKISGNEYVNISIGGTRIARQMDNSLTDIHYCCDFNMRTELIPNDVDFVVCFGGTNDFGHGTAPLGKKTDKDYFTFSGAVNILIDTLIKKVGKENIMFILPLPRYNQDSPDGDSAIYKAGLKATLKEYSAIMEDLLKSKGIFYVDYSEYFLKKGKLNNDLFSDGLHPNDKGHKLLAKLVWNSIKNR